jgi:hypothetical protein
LDQEKMGASPDVFVEVPSPEDGSGLRRRWALAATLVALVIAGGIFVSATAPRVAPFEWERWTGPSGSINRDSLVATSDGFAILSGVTVDGVRLWSSSDGETWEASPLQDSPSQLATIGGDLIGYGVTTGRMISAEADGWVQAAEQIIFPDEVRSRQGSGQPSVVGAGEGFVTMSLLGEVWWSSDGSRFDRVVAEPDWGPGQTVDVPFDSSCRPPSTTSPDVPPMVSTDTTVLAMVSSNPAAPFGISPVCEPRIWISDDGRSWAENGIGFEDGTYVYDLAWREGRFTAVGGTGIGLPAVWTSTDARDWDLVDDFAALSSLDLYKVEAGGAGWVILGQESGGPNTVGWTSRDGLCWTALPEEVGGGDTVVSSERVVVLDPVTFPELWVGTSTGGAGRC